MKKLSVLLAVALLCSFVLFGCTSGGGNTSTPTPPANDTNTTSTEPGTATNDATPTPADTGTAGEEPVTLTIQSLEDPTGTNKLIAEEVHRKFPNVTLEYIEIPGNSDDAKKSLITSLAAAQDEPDMFMMDVIWTTQFASAGWLMDLTDTLDQSQFLGGPLSTVTWNNKVWAVPCYTDVQVLYYRTDLVKTPPKTWQEMYDIAKENVGKNGIEWGVLYQAFQGEPIVCNALTFIKSNGGNDVVDGKSVINSPNAKEALEFMRKLIDDKLTSEEALTQKPVDQRPIFEEGKAVFMLNWPGHYKAMQDGETTKIKDKFSVCEFPVGPSGTKSGPTVGGWNIAVNAYTSHPDIAKQVVLYLNGPECSKIRTLGQSTLPANKAVYDDPEVTSQNPVVQLAQGSLQNACSRPNAPDYPAMSQLLAVNLNKALSKQISYDEGLVEIEKGIGDLLK